MAPYRRHFVGLPLQRSLFHGIGRAGEILDQAGVLPGARVEAWLDDRGDLYLNRACVQRVAASLPGRFTNQRLYALERARRTACAAVIEASERCARMAASLDEEAVRRWLADLGARVAGLIPYGILSKFVPDALLRALAVAGNKEPPPFPQRSAGASLTADLLALFRDWHAKGYAPERLEAEWPAVAPLLTARVHDACDHLAGFGPLAWDSPGYEEPRFLFRMLRLAFTQVDLEEFRRRLAAPAPRPAHSLDGSEGVGILRRALAGWLDFLERETWYVRRAFYRGMVPLLRRLSAGYRRRHPGFQTDDLLFLRIEDLTAGDLDLAAIRARRQKYLADSAYLARQGVEPKRLGTFLEER
jgi:hypothetical protein